MNQKVKLFYLDSILYNSCYVVDRKGELVTNYRKILMFETDKLYFTPGKDRPVLELKNLEGQIIRVKTDDSRLASAYAWISTIKMQ